MAVTQTSPEFTEAFADQTANNYPLRLLQGGVTPDTANDPQLNGPAWPTTPSYDQNYVEDLSQMVQGAVIGYDSDNIAVYEASHETGQFRHLFNVMRIRYALEGGFRTASGLQLSGEWLVGGEFRAELRQATLAGLGADAIRRSQLRRDFHLKVLRIYEHPENFIG